ncbi:hypothetical protein NQ317_001957 [Molorchus minor]|uniref:Uncharacterized protein n=1 Tax=Molorchus minor TaxID=1323400 RepID=A0ABQ9JB58_9CUCU|nr:hypothetical protein NQ317_001957 [Molorchus minor]
MRIIVVLLMSAFCSHVSFSAPTGKAKEVLLFPTRASSVYNYMPYPPPPFQTRGPFDFIGNWIQSSEWFPVEINVPDTVSSIGNGVGTFATNVGSGFNNFAQNVGIGFQTFTQNLGNGFQSFTQNLTERFPILAVFVRPNSPPRYFVLVPKVKANNRNNNDKSETHLNHINDLLEVFP